MKTLFRIGLGLLAGYILAWQTFRVEYRAVKTGILMGYELHVNGVLICDNPHITHTDLKKYVSCYRTY